MVRIVGIEPPPGAIIRAAMLDELVQLPDSDTGNAEAFVMLYGNRFRYDHSRKRWMVWNGLAWVADSDGEAERAAIDTARWRGTAAWLKSIKEQRKHGWWDAERVAAAREGESVQGIKATLDVAKNLRSIATVAKHYDRDPFLLTVSNGTIDLRSGQLRMARPDDLITRATDINYDPAAKCPKWVQFLGEIFEADCELIDFIQCAVGYSMTGDTREQCLFILHGNGANGKSTLLDTIRGLLGPHAITTPFATFMVQRNIGAPRNDLAALVGARFVISSEAGQDAGFDEAVVKQVTGQDRIACRFLYGEFFEYTPQFKIWLATNYKPTIRGNDHAIWRRIRLIPFNQQFKGDRRDPTLLEKLRAELPGILAWAVRGCLSWQREGLGRPETVLKATTEYRQESDQVGRFLSDRCTKGQEYSVSGKYLYGAYVNFCQQLGEKPLANNVFAAQISKHGYEKKRTRQGQVYQGLGLQTAAGSAEDGQDV
jgi:putative DNA primase/helicase